MNKTVVGSLAVLVATIAFAQSTPAPEPGKSQASRDPEVMREKIRSALGGRVRKPDSGEGWIKFVNAQTLVDAASLKFPVLQLGATTQFNVAIVEGKAASLEEVPSAVKAADANLGIVLLESDVLPTSIVAPDSGWAVINVRALAADKKEASVVAARTQKEMYRTFGYLCGAAFTLDKTCVMRPVNSLADLDAAGSVLSPQAFPRITQYLKAQGIKPIVIKTYRSALKEGWAPPPADKYQQVLWEKCKAEANTKPSNPMKITKEKK